GHEPLTRTLLEAGADRAMQSDWGDSALTMAMRNQHLRLAKMISSPEEFAIAVKAPPETYAPVPRSLAPTPAIAAILDEIRAAEAEGRPSEALHRKLQAAMSALRDEGRPPQARKVRAGTPRGVVITARRGQPGAERVEIVTDRAHNRTAVKKAGGSSSQARGEEGR
ncbi:MAG TPA: ankyrin repeat domain-containing protein, partial [Accumulibacter sp.]|nr:ankyrin repeat domain-containing protein [Accumulibacter sp.]